MKLLTLTSILFFLFFFGLNSYSQSDDPLIPNKTFNHIDSHDTEYKTIHIFVALCDNKYQGIVPVPKAIGNGQDPNNNLYWGCGYGIKTFFKKSADWKLVKTIKQDSIIMERLIFKHTSKDIYLIADAYNGYYIKQCTYDFLKSSAGQFKDTIHLGEKILGVNGNARLLSYIGHDGLMDFYLDYDFTNKDEKVRDVIILACISKDYFAEHVKQTKANPLVWTTGLMCPEAYTVHDAIRSYVYGKTGDEIRESAAQAYNKYQKCGINGARRLLVRGF